ncbi:MAG TPA: MOSC N-terminal beta barrel domain-containing protein [Anaerolineales bacterium]|jgi:hypothetical protein
MSQACLTTISIYPVKSMRGQDVDSARVERMGLENDRRFMVVDADGVFLTQREHARMALIKPVLKPGSLNLAAPGMDELTFATRRMGKSMLVDIWRSSGVHAIDQGDPAAEWLTAFLGQPARLVRFADDHRRLVDPTYALQPDDHVGFADGFPLLIISQESLEDLNSRMEKPIPMNRFRPNLVVSGVLPFAEDTWRRIRIGQVEMALVKPCARCNIPTIDQDTGEAGKEPNTTLAKYRRVNGKVMFGVNVIPVSTGRLQLGDALEVLE